MHKLTKTNPKQRYLWIDLNSLDLRWSKSGPFEPLFKSKKLNQITRIRRVASSKKPIYAIQIEMHGQKTVYRVDSLRKRELWFTALSAFVDKPYSSSSDKENQRSPVGFTKPSASFALSDIRSEFNRAPSWASQSVVLPPSRPVLQETARLLFSEVCNGSSLETLPDKLEETVHAKRRRILELQRKIEAAADFTQLLEDFKRAKLRKQLNELQVMKQRLSQDLDLIEKENAEARNQVKEFE